MLFLFLHIRLVLVYFFSENIVFTLDISLFFSDNFVVLARGIVHLIVEFLVEFRHLLRQGLVCIILVAQGSKPLLLLNFQETELLGLPLLTFLLGEVELAFLLILEFSDLGHVIPVLCFCFILHFVNFS